MTRFRRIWSDFDLLIYWTIVAVMIGTSIFGIGAGLFMEHEPFPPLTDSSLK